jgi:hypothetical protein
MQQSEAMAPEVKIINHLHCKLVQHISQQRTLEEV